MLDNIVAWRVPEKCTPDFFAQDVKGMVPWSSRSLDFGSHRIPWEILARLWGDYGRQWVVRVIPSFFILCRRVLGWRFRILAAPFGPSITPPAC